MMMYALVPSFINSYSIHRYRHNTKMARFFILSLLPFVFIMLIHLGRIYVLAEEKTLAGVTFPAVFVFGDSTVDPGNNNQLKTVHRGNFPPYGRDFKGHVPTGRFSNGKLVPDFIASKLGIKELVPAYLDPNITTNDLLTGVSFGSAASGYDNLTAEITSSISLWKQMTYLNQSFEQIRAEFGKQRAEKIKSEALYIVSTGGNDFQINYFRAPFRKLFYTIPEYITFLVHSSSHFFKRLYEMGARNIVVIGIPPLGCLPYQRTLDGGHDRECNNKLNSICEQYQSKFTQEIKNLTEELQGSKILFFDAYTVILDLIHKSNDYGFDVATLGCCGTGTLECGISCNHTSSTCSDASKYLFWDSVHPTERGYEIIADEIIRLGGFQTQTNSSMEGRGLISLYMDGLLDIYTKITTTA